MEPLHLIRLMVIELQEWRRLRGMLMEALIFQRHMAIIILNLFPVDNKIMTKLSQCNEF